MSDKTTINDLLAQDDVNECINDLTEAKSNIKHLIVIYCDNEEDVHWAFGGSPKVVEVNYYLDMVKHHVMFEDD